MGNKRDDDIEFTAGDIGHIKPQSAGVHRYYDARFEHYAVKVFPGTHYVTKKRDEMLVTILGSCVSACIRDTKLGIGGMNHFMLPKSDSGKWGGASAAMRYGNHAMETLINDILSMGGAKNRLELKIFGGGHMLKSQNRIGEKNTKFILDYLKNEHLAAAATDLGGDRGRRIHFFPASGKVKMKLMPHTDDQQIYNSEKLFKARIESEEIEGSIDLF